MEACYSGTLERDILTFAGQKGLKFLGLSDVTDWRKGARLLWTWLGRLPTRPLVILNGWDEPGHGFEPMHVPPPDCPVDVIISTRCKDPKLFADVLVEGHSKWVPVEPLGTAESRRLVVQCLQSEDGVSDDVLRVVDQFAGGLPLLIRIAASLLRQERRRASEPIHKSLGRVEVQLISVKRRETHAWTNDVCESLVRWFLSLPVRIEASESMLRDQCQRVAKRVVAVLAFDKASSDDDTDIGRIHLWKDLPTLFLAVFEASDGDAHQSSFRQCCVESARRCSLLASVDMTLTRLSESERRFLCTSSPLDWSSYGVATSVAARLWELAGDCPENVADALKRIELRTSLLDCREGGTYGMHSEVAHVLRELCDRHATSSTSISSTWSVVPEARCMQTLRSDIANCAPHVSSVIQCLVRTGRLLRLSDKPCYMQGHEDLTEHTRCLLMCLGPEVPDHCSDIMTLVTHCMRLGNDITDRLNHTRALYMAFLKLASETPQTKANYERMIQCWELLRRVEPIMQIGSATAPTLAELCYLLCQEESVDKDLTMEHRVRGLCIWVRNMQKVQQEVRNPATNFYCTAEVRTGVARAITFVRQHGYSTPGITTKASDLAKDGPYALWIRLDELLYSPDAHASLKELQKLRATVLKDDDPDEQDPFQIVARAKFLGNLSQLLLKSLDGSDIRAFRTSERVREALELAEDCERRMSKSGSEQERVVARFILCMCRYNKWVVDRPANHELDASGEGDGDSKETEDDCIPDDLRQELVSVLCDAEYTLEPTMLASIRVFVARVL